MLKRLSNEQLEKLLLHTVGINSILVDALINPPQNEPPFEVDTIADVNLDIVVIDPNRGRAEQPKEQLNLDALCGDWKGGKKKPDLLIFKAAPGYMIALGKKPKNGDVGDCWLIHEFRGNLCFNAGDGAVIISYDEKQDTITLFPGGEYKRIEAKS